VPSTDPDDRLPDWRRHLRFWGRDERRDADDELAFHIESAADEFVAGGMSREDARAAAARRFGDVDQVSRALYSLGHQRERRMRRTEWLDTVRQDVTFALRQLRRSPGFTAVALLTLALGIGANSAIFSVVYGVLLKPLPYENATRIVRVRGKLKGGENYSVTFGDWHSWRTRAKSFEAIGATIGGPPLALSGAGETVPVTAGRASAEYWKAMHIRPALGHYYAEADDREGAPPVVVVSYALWKNRLGGDSAIVGHSLMLDGQPRVVVGVASPEYILGPPAERIWVPLAPSARSLEDHLDHELSVYALVRAGVPTERAVRELEAIQAGIAREIPGNGISTGVIATPLADWIIGSQRTLLLTLLGAVGLVLLIACANVANLLIARSSVRRGEFAIRAALGASRGRIVGQLVVESLVLALAGGVVGTGIAVAGVRFLVTSPASIPRLGDSAVDGPVLLFTALLSVVCALVFGLLPALRASTFDLQPELREGGRDHSGAVRERSRALLVVGELCLAQVLVVGAGLLIRSSILLQSVNPGFDPTNLLVTAVALPSSRYAETASQGLAFDRIAEAMAAVPGVRSVGRTMRAPIHGGGYDCTAIREGAGPDDPKAEGTSVRSADPAFFSTIGASFLRGRAFTALDKTGGVPVAIVNQTLARRLFGDANPIGRRVANCIRSGADTEWHEVVGVIADMHAQGLANESPAELYYPTAQFVTGEMAFVIKGSVPVATLVPSLRRAVAGVDPLLALSKVETMEAAISDSLALPHFSMWLLTLLGGTGLLLAVVGVYGVIAYIVSQRTREMGIRIALGARSSAIQWMLVRKGLVLGVGGVLVGSAASFAATRVLVSMMYGITVRDPLTFVAVAALLTVVTVCASWLPARRATKIDPITSLRGG
jgi:predicted permease